MSDAAVPLPSSSLATAAVSATAAAAALPTAHPVVPETLQPIEPPPLAGCGIHWSLAPIAAVLALFMPRRLGPYLAVSTWRAAYVAHVFGLLAGWVVFVTFLLHFVEPSEAGMTFPITLRFALAMLAPMGMFFASDWTYGLPALLAVVVFECGFWLLALLAMPWYAAGETRRRLYFRCVKLLLWTTLGLTPVAPLVLVSVQEIDHAPIWIVPVGTLLLVWYVTILLRIGDRYAGPPIGPGFLPRAIHCGGCGYPLAYLPVAGRCPECGAAVQSSLPDARELPPCARPRSRWHFIGSSAFLRTWWTSLNGRRFGQRAAVLSGRPAARRFALYMCCATGFIALGLMPLLFQDLMQDMEDLQFRNLDLRQIHEASKSALGPLARFCSVIALIWSTGFSAALILLIVFAALITRFGFSGTERRTTVLCYASGALCVPAIMLVLGIYGCYYVTEIWRPRAEFWLPGLKFPVSLEVLACLLAFAPTGIASLLWLLHLRRMLRATRYANA